MLTCLAVVLLGPAAVALDEAQIVDVSCDGLRVTQRGLPAGLELEVTVIDAPTGRKLLEHVVTSTRAGTIDVPLAVSLRGIKRVVVEVERHSDKTEYGEVGADLPQPCSSRSTPPVRPTAWVPPATPASAASRPSTPRVSPSSAATPSEAAVPATSKSDSWTDTSGVLGALLVVAGVGTLVGSQLAYRRRA